MGETLQIELPGTGNTKKGVLWRLDELDETIWDLTEAYNQSLKKDNPGFTEGPNLEHWRFKAVQAGSSTVRILNYQPWENKDMVDKNFSIKTIVKLWGSNIFWHETHKLLPVQVFNKLTCWNI